MDTLLRIDTSIRGEASHSRAIADRLQARWCDAYPGGRVVARDLALDPPTHLDAGALAAFWGSQTTGAEVSERLIAELRDATDLLISTPLYNFGIPSTLKAWIDQVVRSGYTFELRDGGFEPLLQGRTAYVAAARGLLPDGANGENYLLPQLCAALRFIGWPFVEVLEVVGTSLPEPEPGARLAEALRAADALFESRRLQVLGEPSAVDRAAIDELGAVQVRAILQGDALAYARLCTDDVCLLLPGHDLARGRAAFIARQDALLAPGRVRHFEKHPVQLTFDQDTAVEVGLQRVLSDSAKAGRARASVETYTHVLRRTAFGWRFSMLMSNPASR